MKKISGTILIAAVLMAHVAITIASEEAYIFSASDYSVNEMREPAAKAVITANAQPAAANLNTAGLFSADEAFFTF